MLSPEDEVEFNDERDVVDEAKEEVIDVAPAVEVPRIFEVARSHLRFDQIMIDIEAEISRGRLRLGNARQRADAVRGAPRDIASLSLVRRDFTGDGDMVGATSTVLLVRWKGARVATPVRVDEDNKVIFEFLPESDFSDSKVLIADVSVKMDKARKAHRTQLPDWVMAIWDAEEAALNPGSQPDRPCVACVIGGRHGVMAAATAQDGECFQSVRCLSFLHEACNHALVAVLGHCADGGSGDEFVCGFCAAKA